MILFNWGRKKVSAEKPKRELANAEEEALLDSLEHEPAQWTIREVSPGKFKADHRGSGIWILAEVQPADIYEFTCSYNGHRFSHEFSQSWGSIVKKRALEKAQVEQNRVSESVLRQINVAFVVKKKD